MGSIQIKDKNSGFSVGLSDTKLFETKTMCIDERCISNNNGNIRCFMKDDDKNEISCDEIKKYFKQFNVDIK